MAPPLVIPLEPHALLPPAKTEAELIQGIRKQHIRTERILQKLTVLEKKL